MDDDEILREASRISAYKISTTKKLTSVLVDGELVKTNHVSQIVNSINNKHCISINTTSSSRSSSPSMLISPKSSHLSRNSSCMSNNGNCSTLNSSVVSSYLNLNENNCGPNLTKILKLNNKKMIKNAIVTCSSVSSSSSSTSSLSANQNVNYINDDCSSVFDDKEDLVSSNAALSRNNTSASCANSHSVNKSNRSSFSNNYDEAFYENDDVESNSSSACNLSRLKIQQEDTQFHVLISECQAWIEVSEFGNWVI